MGGEIEGVPMWYQPSRYSKRSHFSVPWAQTPQKFGTEKSSLLTDPDSIEGAFRHCLSFRYRICALFFRGDAPGNAVSTGCIYNPLSPVFDHKTSYKYSRMGLQDIKTACNSISCMDSYHGSINSNRWRMHYRNQVFRTAKIQYSCPSWCGVFTSRNNLRTAPKGPSMLSRSVNADGIFSLWILEGKSALERHLPFSFLPGSPF